MKILNDRYWVSCKYKEVNPALALEFFLGRIAKDFYHEERNTLDYRGLAGSPLYTELSGFLPALARFDPARQISTEPGRLAFWLNAYNLLSVQSVLEIKSPDGVLEEKGFFSDHAYRIAQMEFALDVIEHGILRGNAPKYLTFASLLVADDPRLMQSLETTDPRIHFALYSACVSSPPLRAYSETHVGRELDHAASTYLERWLEIDLRHNRLKLPKMFDGYSKDFGSKDRCREFVLRCLNDRLTEPQAALVRTGGLRFQGFDWALNQA